jgi:hypothetical protein
MLSLATMSTPQDAPNRKKQKARAARKLTEWRKKQGGEAKPAKTSAGKTTK